MLWAGEGAVFCLGGWICQHGADTHTHTHTCRDTYIHTQEAFVCSCLLHVFDVNATQLSRWSAPTYTEAHEHIDIRTHTHNE